nr:long-chain fatty acid--CoA ligase [Anaerolineae bacterium]
ACIVLRPSLEATEEEIIEFCRDRLRSYQVPRRVYFCQELPRSFVGKVLRRQLVEGKLAIEEDL